MKALSDIGFFTFLAVVISIWLICSTILSLNGIR